MFRRQHVVSDFFHEAGVMRDALDASFKDAYGQRLRWQYFCDPRMYTYLRTTPREAFPPELLERFVRHLRSWCMDNLGLVPIELPSLHLMVNGCRLGLHSDFHNGAWGYVYSLTRWDSRRFSGGETLLLRDGIPSYKKHHVHGEVLYELFPAHFNQLLIFDDRIVHSTPTIEGSMDPLEARIALVGHIRATSPVVSGGLDAEAARRVILHALPELRDRIRNYKDVQGTVTYRLGIDTSGTVESVTILTDNLVVPATGYAAAEAAAAVKSIVHQSITRLKFPAAVEKSVITLPVLVPLPDLRPIQLSTPHRSSTGSLLEWAAAQLDNSADSLFQGSWDGSTFQVRDPIVGSIRFEREEIVASFDAPMWVPSQRERLQSMLTEWTRTAVARVA